MSRRQVIKTLDSKEDVNYSFVCDAWWRLQIRPTTLDRKKKVSGQPTSKNFFRRTEGKMKVSFDQPLHEQGWDNGNGWLRRLFFVVISLPKMDTCFGVSRTRFLMFFGSLLFYFMNNSLQVKLWELELRIKTIILEYFEPVWWWKFPFDLDIPTWKRVSQPVVTYLTRTLFHPPVVDPVEWHLLAFDFCFFFIWQMSNSWCLENLWLQRISVTKLLNVEKALNWAAPWLLAVQFWASYWKPLGLSNVFSLSYIYLFIYLYTYIYIYYVCITTFGRCV